jgi:uncharacterized membrane protein
MSIKLIDALSVVILIMGWWVAFSVYPLLPERIPVHFGFKGEADRWGGRWMIFLLPLAGAAIFALNYWIFEYLSPGSPRPIPPEMMIPLHLLLLVISVMFTYITWRTSEIAFGRARGLGVWFFMILIAILSTCGWMWALARGH